MAQAGMTRWRASNTTTEGNNSDEVQKSLELLDQVLSEFDDLDGGEEEEGGEGERCNSAPLTTTSTPEELESPSLGHTSEDDGYMSMNGRRNKLLLNLTRNNNVPECQGVENVPGVRDCPPPPEEAQRIIANLIPRVSPCNTARRPSPIQNNHNHRVSHPLVSNQEYSDWKTNTSTQTTLPKTRHQRPYGWENGVALPPLRIEEAEPVNKFGSLPGGGLGEYRGAMGSWLPPRTNPCVGEKHREVRRAVPELLVDSLARCETTDEERAGEGGNFSDDSLEDIPLPPIPNSVNKRHSIAWEVPDIPLPPTPLSSNKRHSIAWEVPDIPLPPTPSSSNKRHSIAWEVPLSPGSTRVVARRRRKSGTDHSSTGSISRTSQNLEEWPDPPDCGPDGSDLSLLSSILPADMSSSGTYVIRRGRKRPSSKVGARTPQGVKGLKHKSNARADMASTCADLKRYSSTFDNIRSLLKDGKVDGLDETPPDFPPPTPPGLSRGTSLPSLTPSHMPLLLREPIPLVKRTEFLSSSLENIVDSDLDYQDSNFEYKDSSSLENMLIDRLRQSGDEFDSLDSRINEGLSSCGELDNPRLSFFDLDLQGVDVSDSGQLGSQGWSIKKCESHTSTTDLNTKFSSTDDIDISEPPKPTDVRKCDIAIQVEPGEISLDKREPVGQCQSQVDQQQHTATHTSLSCQTHDPTPDVMAYSSESFVDKEDPEYIRLHTEMNEDSRSKNEESRCKPNEYPSLHEDRRVPTPDYPPEQIPTPDYPQPFSIPAYREKIPTPGDNPSRPGDGGKIPTPDYSKDEMDTMPRVPRVESSRQKCSRGNLKLPLHNEEPRGNLKLHLHSEETVPVVWSTASEMSSQMSSQVHVKEQPLTTRQETALSNCQRGTTSRENSLSKHRENSLSSFKGASPSSNHSGSRNSSLSHTRSNPNQTRQNGNDFKVQVEVIHHEFGPLPPSPVEEDDEFHDTPHPSMPHNQSASLKTRSMDAGFSRNFRSQQLGSRKDVPPERRTLPTDMPGPSRRRSGRGTGTIESSCSLPETPLFSRGCDIPRTPHRRAPEVPTISRTAPRPGPAGVGGTGGTYRPAMMGHGSAVALEQAMVGAELLRMAGPGRGWYPRHRHPRPLSVEHLDRLATHPAGVTAHHPMSTAGGRKPCTLPPNLSPPKFFNKGPRDALRRVTSLLIRGKGSNTTTSKENGTTKKDGMLTSSVIGPHGDSLPEPPAATRPPKRGFFRAFWKRSRHYSLEQQ